MGVYLITGPNGSGKSTVGRELAHRGLSVIETDFDPRLSEWVHTASGDTVTALPPYPFPSQWLDEHRWLWHRSYLEQLVGQHTTDDLFLVGGAYNQREMYDLFTQWFVLYTDDQTMTLRLQSRGEGARWNTGSAELQRALDWNKRSVEISQKAGAIPINSTRPPEIIANEILDYVHAA